MPQKGRKGPRSISASWVGRPPNATPASVRSIPMWRCPKKPAARKKSTGPVRGQGLAVWAVAGKLACAPMQESFVGP